MPRINLASVNEQTGERMTLEPGGYVLKVTGVKHTPGDDKLFLEWDVAEGPMAGTFKDSEWPPYSDRPQSRRHRTGRYNCTSFGILLPTTDLQAGIPN